MNQDTFNSPSVPNASKTRGISIHRWRQKLPIVKQNTAAMQPVVIHKKETRYFTVFLFNRSVPPLLHNAIFMLLVSLNLELLCFTLSLL